MFSKCIPTTPDFRMHQDPFLIIQSTYVNGKPILTLLCKPEPPTANPTTPTPPKTLNPPSQNPAKRPKPCETPKPNILNLQTQNVNKIQALNPNPQHPKNPKP